MTVTGVPLLQTAASVVSVTGIPLLQTAASVTGSSSTTDSGVSSVSNRSNCINGVVRCRVMGYEKC